MVYDVVVVGGGPAGLTAGIYARTRSLSTLILEAHEIGGQLTWLYPTKSVYDYPSYIAIEGQELGELFAVHAREAGAKMVREEVRDLKREGDRFVLRTREGNTHEARAVILAMGIGLFEPRRLGCPGEDEFEGRGLTYHISDRRAFEGKRVLIVGGGDSALEYALEIVASAKEVTLIHRRGEFRAMEKNVGAAMKSPIQVVFNAELTSIEGDGRVERAVVYDNRTLKKTVLDVDAILINIGWEPKRTPLTAWGIELEGERLIKVQADMSTNLPGVYACGDIVSYPGKEKRIVTACGEAVTAVMSVYKYLRTPYWA